ncbi:6793_t:CDS:2 [Ambispora leptoticha]|uniref:6793_t:CDS:1 n=1 Tax=Ambispora leptoticha TaxID=144679 RepID=A0A9N8WTC6_9GLOM|nr:6793_t:CDS:2 [Ambispora leptoticha]
MNAELINPCECTYCTGKKRKSEVVDEQPSSPQKNPTKYARTTDFEKAKDYDYFSLDRNSIGASHLFLNTNIQTLTTNLPSYSPASTTSTSSFTQFEFNGPISNESNLFSRFLTSPTPILPPLIPRIQLNESPHKISDKMIPGIQNSDVSMINKFSLKDNLIVEFNLPPKIHLWCNVDHEKKNENHVTILGNNPPPNKGKDRVNSDLEEIENSNSINCENVDCSLEAKLDPNDPTKRYSYCSSNCFWLESSKLDSVRMTQIQENDPDYSTVRSKFSFGLPNAKIIAIIRLQMPNEITQRYQNYSQNIALEKGVPSENVIHRMFHGTVAACLPLDLIILNRLCKKFCGMCGIAKEGNKSVYSKRRGKMWFASSSQVSLGYCGRNNMKAMFLVDVVSPKCDRILIVDKDEATLPRFLIIFRHKLHNKYSIIRKHRPPIKRPVPA